MLNNKSVSVVLPCRNEERALRETLGSLPKEVDEVIVVDNESTDKTAAVAAKFGAKVFFESRSKNGIGYGFALAQGIREASGDIIVCMDGDGSYPVGKIPMIIKQLDQRKLDFVSCCRLPFKDRKKMSSIRILGVTILNWFIFLLFGFKIHDSLSGMWVFRKKVIGTLGLSEGGWNFSLEIKLNVLTDPGIKFSELSIPYHDRVFDSSKQNLFRTGIEHLTFLFKKRFFTQNTETVKFLLLTKRLKYG